MSAAFAFPQGLAVNPVSGDIFVCDYGNEYIRVIGSGGNVSTLAGTGNPGFDDGDNSAASFNQPRGVACDGKGNVYVADRGNHAVRLIKLESKTTETVAGIGEPVSFLPGGHDDGCEDDCCLPAPVMRKLKSKRAKEQESDEEDDALASAQEGAPAKSKPKPKPFGALEDADGLWG